MAEKKRGAARSTIKKKRVPPWSRPRLASLGVIALVAGVILYWRFGWSRAPTTLAGALLSRAEEFPPGQRVVAPLSTQDRLGYSFTGDFASPVSATTPVPCFFVKRDLKQGGQTFEVDYRDLGDMKAELSGLVSGTADDETLAHVHVAGLNVATALGFPNVNACHFDEVEGSKIFPVITSEVVASEVEVTTHQNMSRRVEVDARRTAAANAGWKTSGSSAFSGQNIVVSAAESQVRVTVSPTIRTPLGSDPRGRVIDLQPLVQLDGNLTIADYEDTFPRLTIQAHLAALDPDDVDGRTTGQCPAESPQRLGPGQRCVFWLAPGNSSIAVWWARDNDDIVLAVKAYRSDFERPKTKRP